MGSDSTEAAPTMAGPSTRHPMHLGAFLSEFLETIPDMVLILDDERQVIAANRLAVMTLGGSVDFLAGHRPGEILGCRGVTEAPSGCGTGDRCGLCGVLQAVLASRRKSEADSREARILVRGENVGALDLLVTARQVIEDGRRLCICILRDISDQKRRAILESLFFHDILNTVGGIHALAGLLTDTDRILPPEREKDCRRGMARLSQRLIEEINHQRDLLEAERGQFVPRVEDIVIPDVVREVRELYLGHPVAQKRHLEIGEAVACTISSDGVIIRRVLGNLVKNALEATAEGGVVRIACRDLGERVALEVNNPGVMPREVQLQVFQRSFSTKAERGRGIGTYSIKLFVERYLKGTVGFTSAEPEGTTFGVTVPKKPAADKIA